MVEFPNPISTETKEVDGDTLVVERYADGSYSEKVKHNNDETVTWYKKDGKKEDYYKTSSDEEYRLATETLPDGTKRGFDRYENLYYESLPDGTWHEWIYDKRNNLTQEIKYHKDSPEKKLIDREWDAETGKPLHEYLEDGTCRLWYAGSGKQKYEKLSDGTSKIWNEKGVMIQQTSAGGVQVNWDDNGTKLDAEMKREYHIAGSYFPPRLMKEQTNEYTHTWDLAGKLLHEQLSSGFERTFEYYEYPNDKIKSEKCSNGTQREWHMNGKLSSEILFSEDGTYKISEETFDVKGKRTSFKHFNKEGKEDTLLYQVKQKVAKANVEKGGNQVQPKLSSFKKMVAMYKAYEDLKTK